ncbi:dCMP deaminase [Malassezia obtusa]|uniref:dCMP deaminase n=1 Tax=Malassezia obtusa TaxID=76774 RepID=A0AAF0DYU5_9BASI|nr:dCMP deaminase [Malassezia obtusa]
MCRRTLTQKLLFPGVGAFGTAMQALADKGYLEPLRKYIASGKPYMGICVGMQALFEGSDESPGVPGLGIVPARVGRFSRTDASRKRRKAVPHIGWSLVQAPASDDAAAAAYGLQKDEHYYFVHSYRVAYEPHLAEWALGTTQYGDETFVSVVQHQNIFATQFHPEKSGAAGLTVLDAWLRQTAPHPPSARTFAARSEYAMPTRRIVACLDVRSNDQGDLVVTKGESYDVRERSSGAGGDVRNMGKPVELAQRYYAEGADEVTFLNITSFRNWALGDQPMLTLLQRAAETIFVPLTIGGGIRDFTDPDGTVHPALDVAHAYFRAGADKVSIGSEAVYAVEKLLERCAALGAGPDPGAAPDAALHNDTGIEQISRMYGSQAVVVSIDPKRVYIDDGRVPPEHVASLVSGADERPGRSGQAQWWYACTVKGGRETRDIDVVQLARGVERLGAGELLINSIDRDGSNAGFDTQLVDLVRSSVAVSVIASSGAGHPGHFAEVFAPRDAAGGASIEAALAAGIFHRREVSIGEVKEALARDKHSVRQSKATEPR